MEYRDWSRSLNHWVCSAQTVETFAWMLPSTHEQWNAIRWIHRNCRTYLCR